MYPPPRHTPPRPGVPGGAVAAIAVACSIISGLGGCAFGAVIATPAPSSSTAAVKTTRPASPTTTTRSSTPRATPTPTRSSFGDGTWRVGQDIPPGTYRAADVDFCHWRRLRGFSGRTADVIASGTTVDGAAIATIKAGDAGFSSVGCNTWERLTSAPPKEKTTAKRPSPKPTAPKTTAAPATDPRYSTCAEANRHGLGPYRRGQTEYSWYQDRDGDGIVCERR